MIYYIIPTIIIAISLLTIIFIIIKKLPNLAAINVDSISKEKETKVINRIMVDRLARKFFDLKKLLNIIISPITKNLSSSWKGFYQNIINLEKENLKKTQPLKEIDINQDIKEKLEEVKKLSAEQDFDKAEELAISVIDLDPKNLDAYEVLVEVYTEKKEYKKARETCRYLIRLFTKNNTMEEGDGNKHRLANCYSDLGTIYQFEKKNSIALKNFQKAVDLEPNNPRFLDLLLKISIMLNDKNLALQVFNALKKADPDNQKLEEIKEEVDSIKK